MPDQTIIVHVKGYWREKDRINLPESPGVFFVYEASFHSSDETVDLLQLIYIGSASNIRSRILQPEVTAWWKEFVSVDHELCFACAEMGNTNQERVKSAYNISQCPPAFCNTNQEFSFDTTTLVSTGKTALLPSVITVRKNINPATGRNAHTLQGDIIPVRAVPLS
ncbi:MAG: hypothetical protein M0P58_10120 [Bacteroidales bacterium]|nr:hypothetical protein [Bacteroidales bacterium]